MNLNLYQRISKFRDFHKGKLNFITHYIIGFPIFFVGIFTVNWVFIILGLLIPELSHIWNAYTNKIPYEKDIFLFQLSLFIPFFSIYIYIIYFT